MRTVDRLNDIIDYLEAHITDEVNMDAIAEIACLSAYDAQRMFSFIAEMSIAEYIRNRRLTLAGYELRDGKAKVIDVALKYGYDSPVSFARAFRSFHGITPGAVKKSKKTLRQCARLVFRITVQEVVKMMRQDIMEINGKSYVASYFGERDMSSWSEVYEKREFWRIEDAYEDFKDCFKTHNVLPYSNYPPMDIQIGQMFVIDYYRKHSDEIERQYYISDGTVWNDRKSTVQIAINIEPLRMDRLTVHGKEYIAEYYGDQYMGHWSECYQSRMFWRLRDAYEDFCDLPKNGQVLPYDNFNPMKIELRQVFVIDYCLKGSDEMERKYYISDGRIWQDMECTSEVILPDDGQSQETAE